MLSLSDNEFAVINFLVRNFYEKLTIRSIALRLKFSPAGVYNILKKLEKEGITKSEKLGTGLFYSINFENKIALHLASIVLLHSSDKIDAANFSKIPGENVIFALKKKLLVVGNISSLDLMIEGFEISSKSKEEFVECIKSKEKTCVEFLSDGAVVSGEGIIVEIIKSMVKR